MCMHVRAILYVYNKCVHYKMMIIRSYNEAISIDPNIYNQAIRK